ncbi:MAG: hypothetical protein WB998_05360 [Solirubrobacteraceae bacterium]
MAAICQGVFTPLTMAFELPESRVYEMVSPPYKADYGVKSDLAEQGASPDGTSFVFSSLGAFAGASSNTLTVPYIARRTLGGWVTSATNPPPADGRLPGGVDYSPDLSRQIATASAQKGGILASEGTAALILSELDAPEIANTQAWPLPDGPATFPGRPGEPGNYAGASEDLSHAIFEDSFGGLYQIVGLGGPQPKEEAVAVVGQADGPGDTVLPECPGASQKDIVELYGRLHAVSGDGSEIFFRRHCGGVFVRVNGSTTLELAPAGEFQGASQDGSKAFFTNEVGELLMDTIDRRPGHEAIGETVQVTPGSPASVVVSSDDGSHIYFVSPGALAGANAQGHSPEAGSSNLYVYDSLTRLTSFIAVVSVETEGFGFQAQTTPDGDYLVFTTASALTPDDTDTAADVYRYDASTGGLERVSVGENGYDENGNDSAFGASIAASLLGASEDRTIPTWRLSTRAITDDGSTIIFSTVEPLSSRAVNGNVDVYVWHEGSVGMISTGLSQSSDEDAVISQSGQDIFFLTRQSILPQDSDGLTDVYDARIDGGFPEAGLPAGGCSGDICQGPPSVPSLLGAPASATFSGLGNPSEETTSMQAKPKGKPKVKGKPKCKSGYKRDQRGKCLKVRKRIGKTAVSSDSYKGARL